MKKSFWWFFAGGLIGGVVMTWLAPGAIAWYYDPGGDLAISCRKSVEEALGRFQLAQFIGVVVGGIAAIILGLTVFRKKDPYTTAIE